MLMDVENIGNAFHMFLSYIQDIESLPKIRMFIIYRY